MFFLVEENKKAMILQISRNCNQFHKMKVGIKEAYDFSKDQKVQNINYCLIENPQDVLSYRFRYLEKVFFHLRNSNKMMLNLINHCEKEEYENLSHFIVHFCYENILNSSFVQEDMLVLIYLLLEQLIENNITPNSSISAFLDQSFLFYIFKSLTRKEDVRSYLIVLLSEIILKMENITEGVLSVQLYKISDLLNSKNPKKSKLPPPSRHRAVSGLYQNTKFGVRKIYTKVERKVENQIFEEQTEGNSRVNTVAGGDLDDQDNDEKFAKMLNDDTMEKTINSDTKQAEEQNVEEVKQESNNDPIDKYFSETETTLNYLKSKLDYYKKEKDNKDNEYADIYKSQELLDFMEKQISRIESEEIFSNNSLLSSLNSTYKMQAPEIKKILVNNAQKIKSLLELLMKNLLDNLITIPYTIKCIMAIIDLLIQKKFKSTNSEISKFDKMMYTVTFFFGTLIIAIISSPDYNGIITTNIISSSTKNNLMVLVKILFQILKGSLFTNEKDCEFTIFNTCIIDLMPSIIALIQSVRKTKLPSVIEKLMQSKGRVDRDVNYNYLTENHNENIEHQSVCFNWNDAMTIIRIIKKNRELFLKEEELKEEEEGISDDEEGKKREKENYVSLKIAMEKIMIYESDFETWEKEDSGGNYLNKGENIEITKPKQKKYVYFSKINYRKEFKDRLNGKVVHSNVNANNAFSFTKKKGRVGQLAASMNLKKSLTKAPSKIQEPSNTENSEISKIKNCLCEILKYINTISKENLNVNVERNIESTESFDNFLLSKLITMIKFENGNSNFLQFQEQNNKQKIPLIFYATYLENNLESLPENYKANNYSLLFSELLKEKEQSVKDAKNEDVINQLYLKVKNSEKLNMIINSNLYQLKQLEKLLNIESFVDKIQILITLNCIKEGDLIKSIEIEELPKKGKIKKTIPGYCDSINSFIAQFPNLNELKVDDILDYQENVLQLDKVLLKYFGLIKASLKTNERFSKYTYEELNAIHDDLTNYIVSKIYDKIFPKKRTKKDIKIYKKCKRLEWIKPKHLIKDQKVINEKLWKTAMDYINEMDNEKTPSNKIKSFGKAYAIIQNSITFCTGKDDLGVDDSIQVLIYVMLKAQPKRILTNFNYARIYIDPELSKKQFGLLLTQMEMIVTIIENMKYTDLIDVKEQDFGIDEKEEDINVDLEDKISA